MLKKLLLIQCIYKPLFSMSGLQENDDAPLLVSDFIKQSSTLQNMQKDMVDIGSALQETGIIDTITPLDHFKKLLSFKKNPQNISKQSDLVAVAQAADKLGIDSIIQDCLERLQHVDEISEMNVTKDLNPELVLKLREKIKNTKEMQRLLNPKMIKNINSQLPNGRLITSSSGNYLVDINSYKAKICNLQGTKLVELLANDDDRFLPEAAFSCNDKELILISKKGNLNLLNIEDKTIKIFQYSDIIFPHIKNHYLSSYIKNKEIPFKVIINTDNTKFATLANSLDQSSCLYSKVNVYNLKGNHICSFEEVIQENFFNLKKISFSPQYLLCILFFSDYNKEEILLWNIETRKKEFLPFNISDIALHPSDKALIYTHKNEKVLHIKDMETNERQDIPLKAEITDLQFNPNGTIFAGIVNEEIFLWNFNTKKPITSFFYSTDDFQVMDLSHIITKNPYDTNIQIIRFVSRATKEAFNNVELVSLRLLSYLFKKRSIEKKPVVINQALVPHFFQIPFSLQKILIERGYINKLSADIQNELSKLQKKALISEIQSIYAEKS
jgi:hypothetical protein